MVTFLRPKHPLHCKTTEHLILFWKIRDHCLMAGYNITKTRNLCCKPKIITAYESVTFAYCKHFIPDMTETRSWTDSHGRAGILKFTQACLGLKCWTLTGCLKRMGLFKHWVGESAQVAWNVLELQSVGLMTPIWHLMTFISVNSTQRTDLNV